ncbi:HIT family protein [Mangrovibacillus cuniculi]|uniref:HIT family protein n=1 Tax=Mangrovibacillus cuniculi TaxID=2593652 RepID=A0A7S8C8V8_9BACI|nr:HIT family protein [Mangrovibacillus cuniculi]QPC45555.1 HIT family protein [Mangrovibacillus cuniculi]
MTCVGCLLANHQAPTHLIYEDEHVSCILDIDPYNEGHVLILPKKHVRYFDDLDHQTSLSIMHAAGLLTKVLKELFKPDGITILQNGGKFDDLTHFHMHIIPRFEGQNFAEFFLENQEINSRGMDKLVNIQKKLLEEMKTS